MRYNVYRMCENPQVWEFMRRFWELFTMFRFLHDIYQFVGIIIYSIALLVNEQFDIGRKNKKNVLLWKKSLMKACKAEINILSLQSLSWIQSFYLKGLIPIEIECLSLWSVGHFFCFSSNILLTLQTLCSEPMRLIYRRRADYV